MEPCWSVDVASADYVLGWAIVPEGLREVSVYLDGRHVGNAHLRLERPDVALGAPQVPEMLSKNSGFFLKLRGARDWSQPQIRVVARTAGGSVIQPFEGTSVQSGSLVQVPLSCRAPFFSRSLRDAGFA
jgi:hypothetical protein